MSDASIMQTLVLNQPLAFTTSTGIDRVKVHNDSSYYLRVYFGLGAPADPNGGGWHDTIGPGASPVIAVVGAARGVQGFDLTNSQSTGTYQGQIVVLPFLPVGAPTPSGVVAGAALCYLTGYYPDEYAETAGQIEAFVQAAKQGRYQEVSGGFPASGLQQTPLTQAATANTLTYLVGNVTTSTAPNLYTANAAGTSFVNVYVYWLWWKLRNLGPNLAGCHATFTLYLTDNANTIPALNAQNIPFDIFLTAPNFDVDEIVYAPSKPLCMQFNLAQNALTNPARVWLGFLGFQAANARANTGSWELITACHAAIDTVNQTALYDKPVRTLTNLPSWSTYNPQTY